MDIKELVYKNRTYRRFEENYDISIDDLKRFVDLARMSPNGANKQSLRYILSNEKEKNAKIYETLSWAAYLKDWDGPISGERPSAYIIMLNEKNCAKEQWAEAGISAQSLCLGAVEKGLGCCMFRGINRELLTKSLNIPNEYEIYMVIAIGKPVEIISIDEMKKDDSVKYWRDENGVHHVPKRGLEDVILYN